MSAHRLFFAAVTASSILAAASPARAQNNAGAEALYRDGKRLFAEGKIHEACAKLSASQRADPALGTLVALAACHEKEGKVASAWSEYTEGVALAKAQGDVERGDYAMQHAAALEPKVHRVVVGMVDPPHDLKVVIGESSYGVAVNGTPLPVDPGTYEIVASAAGKKPWKRELVVPASGGKTEIVVAKLEDVPVVASSTNEAFPARKVGAIAAAGAGVVLVGAGVIAMSIAGSQSDTAQERAAAANLKRSPTAYKTAEDAHDRATLNQGLGIGALALGGVALGVGAFLWFTGGAQKKSPSVGSLRVTPLVGPVAGIGGTF